MLLILSISDLSNPGSCSLRSEIEAIRGFQIMKEKKYYFIQIEKDFFQSQKMEELKEQALDDEENPFVYISIYQMLILSSLENNGFIFIDNNKTMNPGFLKLLIHFRTGTSKEKDIATIDKCIKALEMLDLIIIEGDSLIIPNIKKFTSSETERKDQTRLNRIKASNKLKELKEKYDSDGLNQISAMLNSDEQDVLISGLIFKKFITKEEKSQFKDLIKKISESYGSENTLKAIQIFIERIERTNIDSITNKNNYFEKTISKIIEDEILTGNDKINPIIDLLVQKNLILNQNGIIEFTRILKSIQKKTGADPNELFSAVENNILLFIKNKNNLSQELFESVISDYLNGKKLVENKDPDISKNFLDEQIEVASFDIWGKN